MTVNYKLEGLDCANCAAKLERKLNAVKGVEEANINFMALKLIVEYASEEAEAEVFAAIKKFDSDITVERL